MVLHSDPAKTSETYVEGLQFQNLNKNAVCTRWTAIINHGQTGLLPLACCLVNAHLSPA